MSPAAALAAFCGRRRSRHDTTRVHGAPLGAGSGGSDRDRGCALDGMRQLERQPQHQRHRRRRQRRRRRRDRRRRARRAGDRRGQPRAGHALSRRRLHGRAFNDPYYYPRYGYGTQIGKYLSPSVTVNNLALSGRSSKSYIDPADNGNYAMLMSGLKAGDYLMIGFGHNDEKGRPVAVHQPEHRRHRPEVVPVLPLHLLHQAGADGRRDADPDHADRAARFGGRLRGRKGSRDHRRASRAA